MTTITIPPAALEAGAKAVAALNENLSIDALRAAIAAALNAWPGVRKSQHVSFDGRTETAIILPLPQEASDE